MLCIGLFFMRGLKNSATAIDVHSLLKLCVGSISLLKDQK